MLRENTETNSLPFTKSCKKRADSRLESRARELLIQQMENLTSKLQAQASEMAQGTFDEGDYADRASKTARQSKRLAMGRLWQNMLEEAERALIRLEQGTYGFCQRCGVTIPEERLVAMPSATFCIECARRQERT